MTDSSTSDGSMGSGPDLTLKPRLQNIDPYDFEAFVADLLGRQGWDTSVTQGSNDMGVDVWASKSDGMVETRMAVQAKRYSAGNKVGRQKVQQYHSLKIQDKSVDQAAIVTTSAFTSGAEDWAAEHNVKLIDGADLVQLINDGGHQDLVNEYAPSLDRSQSDESAETGSPLTIDQPLDDGTMPPFPEPFDDPQTRTGAAVLIGLLGVGVLANAASQTMTYLGTGLLLAGIVVGARDEEIWDAITPDERVYRRFSDGGAVLTRDGIARYRPAGDDASDVVFDSLDGGTGRLTRQQANVYGILQQRYNDLPILDTGSLPTVVVDDDQRWIAAYRFAVQDERPEAIATAMGMDQKEVVRTLEAVADA